MTAGTFVALFFDRIFRLLSLRGDFRAGTLTEPADVRRLFCICWLVYCVAYLGRLNYSSAMLPMLNAAVLTPSSAGWVHTAYFAAYAVGNIVNGFAADRADPRRMVCVGLLASAAANLVMIAELPPTVQAVFWGVNGWAQAMIWAPLLRVFSVMLDANDKINACVNIVSSQVIGNFASYLLSAGLLKFLSWHWLFAVPAAILSACALFWHRIFGGLLKKAGRTNERGVERSRNASIDLRGVLIGTGLSVVVIPAVVHGTLKDGLTAWIPTYLGESFSLSASAALFLTAVVPLMNLSGAYIAKAVHRATRENTVVSCVLLMAAGAAMLALLVAAQGSGALVSAVLLSGVTAMMMAVNTLLVAIFPLRFEKHGCVSLVSGLINALGYLGAAVSMAGAGYAIEHFGWTVTLCAAAASAAFAAMAGVATLMRRHE